MLRRQLNNAVLLLLAGTAVLSAFLGDDTQSIIIGIILVVSIGLGFVNEYRAERATEALHSRVQHTAVVRHNGDFVKVNVTELVPGDVIRLTLGEAVPADVRLIEVNGLECNEGILTGESMASEKSPNRWRRIPHSPIPPTWRSWARSSAPATATGWSMQRRRRTVRPHRGRPRRASARDRLPGRLAPILLPAAVGGAELTVIILITNLLLRRPVIDSLLFALAIAVGITPQLLPAVVSSSLASGARQLARCKVLVKRLVSIEDLGDIDILITDKTGTLTDGPSASWTPSIQRARIPIRCCAPGCWPPTSTPPSVAPAATTWTQPCGNRSPIRLP